MTLDQQIHLAPTLKTLAPGAELSTRVSAASGFVLDMDGTILDSYDAHYRAWHRVLAEHGLDYTREEIVAPFGKPTPVIASLLFKSDDAEFVTRVARLKAEYFMAQTSKLELFPGTRDVLAELKSRGKRTCIASSSPNAVIAKVIADLDLTRFIDAYVGLGDIKNGKPDPEMIVKSCERLGIVPSDCIVIGDTEYDIKAGNAAGCYTVAVLTGGNFTKEQLVAAGAGHILPDFGSLLGYIA